MANFLDDFRALPPATEISLTYGPAAPQTIAEGLSDIVLSITPSDGQFCILEITFAANQTPIIDFGSGQQVTNVPNSWQVHVGENKMLITCFNRLSFPSGITPVFAAAAQTQEWIIGVRAVDWFGNIINGGINFISNWDDKIPHVVGGSSTFSGSMPGDMVANNDTVLSDTSAPAIGDILEKTEINRLTISTSKQIVRGRSNTLLKKIHHFNKNKIDRVSRPFTSIKKSNTVRSSEKNGSSGTNNVPGEGSSTTGDTYGGGGTY